MFIKKTLDIDIIDKVYDLIQKFPKNELFGLTSQLKKASVSIALNIAEDLGSSDKNFNRYIGIAKDSLKECIVCLTITKSRAFISEEENMSFRKEFTVIAKMLANLGKYLKNNSKD